MSELFTRTFQLEDISIRSGGDGRTVDAYAAVFNAETDIRDQQGSYREQLHPSSFDRTLSHGDLSRFQVLYNHGRTIYGADAPEYSKPLGVPVEIRPDSRGLFTRTRYSRTALADEVLELIKDGAIRAQSFQGRFTDSNPKMPRGGYRATNDGTLPLVTRMEIALKEYGPTPFPAYSEAAVVGVRSIVNEITGLTSDERAELIRLLSADTHDPGQGHGSSTENTEPAVEGTSGDAATQAATLTRAQVRARLYKLGVLLP